MSTYLDKVSTKAYMGTHGSLEVNLIADYPLAYADDEQVSASRVSTYSPRSVLWSVSLASHTLNHPPTFSVSNSVTVRQAPFTAIESPTRQSPDRPHMQRGDQRGSPNCLNAGPARLSVSVKM